MPERATAEYEDLSVTITRAETDDALVVFIDGPADVDLNPDGSPAIRVHLNDATIYEGRPLR